MAHLLVVLEAATREHHAVPGTDGSLFAVCLHHHTDDATVLGDQIDESGVQAQRDTGLPDSEKQFRGEGGAHRDQSFAGQLGNGEPRGDLDRAQGSAPVTQSCAQPAVVRLHHHHVQGGFAVRGVQGLDVVTQFAGVERLGLTGAPAHSAARCLRVVVGVVLDPLQFEGRVLAQEVERLGAAVDVGVDALGCHTVAHDGADIGPCGLGIVLDAVTLEHLVVRDPDTSTRPGGGSTPVRRLLDDHCVEAMSGGRDGRTHTGATGADDDHIEDLVPRNLFRTAHHCPFAHCRALPSR